MIYSNLKWKISRVSLGYFNRNVQQPHQVGVQVRRRRNNSWRKNNYLILEQLKNERDNSIKDINMTIIQPIAYSTLLTLLILCEF